MSAWLDAHREVIALVAAELCRPGLKPTGRDGLPAESVLRCALLKQYRQLSYQELAFHLSDSASFRAFARLPLHWCPKKSVLQETISAISARTWGADQSLFIGQRQRDQGRTGTLLRLVAPSDDPRAERIACATPIWCACWTPPAMPQAPAICIITAGGPSGVPRPSIIAASRPSGMLLRIDVAICVRQSIRRADRAARSCRR